MTEIEFAKKISEAGGKAYLVGGAVRDYVRGVKAKDRDYCVTGLDERTFSSLFVNTLKVGKSFPVYMLEIDTARCEVAFARTERKVGTGYHGFEILFSPSVTIEEDLYRRDTTINAMAIEILSNKLIDPFNGYADVINKKIRPVSKHFIDDPVRALRAARQAAQFNFEICAETFEAMKFCEEELSREPAERIFDELEIALKTDKPSIFFRSLERANLLKITFPEIAQLRGKIQPSVFHPEGDAYEHSLNILDDVSKINPKPVVRFAALVHDLGKGTTPLEMLPHHYLHEKRGLEVLNKMNRRMTLPNDWRKVAAFVIKEHMRAPRLKKAGKIVDLLLNLQRLKISVKDFCDIITIDNHGLPLYLEKAQKILDELLKIGGKDAPSELKGAQIGNWIHDARIKLFVKIYSKEIQR